MNPDQQQIRTFVLGQLQHIADDSGASLPDIADDHNLLESGLLDSYRLVELITSIGGAFDIDFDLSEMDPDEFTTFGGLVRCFAK